MKRIHSIDFARGLVIVIMALDHIRDLMHTTALTQNPLDLNSTSGPLFLTRWITHFCAPSFVFLAGTSAYLSKKGKDNLSATRGFLRSRGLWLLLMEFTVICLGMTGDILFRTLLLQVIFAIGMGFVILSFLLALRPKLVGGMGLAIILSHNLLQGIPFTNPVAQFFSSLLFSPGAFPLPGERLVIIGYPIIPWLGIMLFGYGCGQVFEKTPESRRKALLGLGIGALALFVLLRFLNIYGDPSPWAARGTWVGTVLSFINVTKYPPSLLFAALTLGFLFLILWLADEADNKLTRFFTVYGKVPFFFFIVHWYVIHASMFVMVWLQGAQWKDMVFVSMGLGRPATGSGLELPYIYLYWACLVAVFYPLCRWYGKYKATHRDKKWLSYL